MKIPLVDLKAQYSSIHQSPITSHQSPVSPDRASGLFRFPLPYDELQTCDHRLGWHTGREHNLERALPDLERFYRVANNPHSGQQYPGLSLRRRGLEMAVEGWPRKPSKSLMARGKGEIVLNSGTARQRRGLWGC